MPFIVAVVLNLLLDWLIMRKLRRSPRGGKWKSRLHLVLTVALTALLVVIVALPVRQVGNGQMHLVMWLIFTYFAFYLPKYFALLVWLPGLLPCFAARGKRVFTHAATVVGVLLFAVLWWGALVNPYRTQVRRVDLSFSNLPASFEGYRIVHFSDAHLGTYNGDTAFVARYVKEMNDLRPDVICFTGDLVNRQTSEAEPFVKVLSRLRARDGVFSVLGNHDYDDYMQWPAEAQKLADRAALVALQRKAGWDLLNDEHRAIVRGTDTIMIIGTENVGDPPFPVYGDLHRAYPTPTDSLFKVMLQHNPYAWRQDLLKNSNIALTLSGHTHAMQMMLTVLGRDYSPAAWRYGEWCGAYHEGEQVLYVNIGIGMVGFPARLGSALPEITVITLHKKK